MVQYTSQFLAECSLAVWSSVRSTFKNGILFLNEDLADAVARCPGAQAIHDLGAACLLSLDEPPAALRAAANTFPRNEPLNVCFAITSLLSDASDSIVELIKALPFQSFVTVLTTVSSTAHESSARTTLEDDAYDYILSIWEEALASHGCPRHTLSVQYLPMHVKVVGGVGFQLLLSDTAFKAVEKDIAASTTNDITYVRQVCFSYAARERFCTRDMSGHFSTHKSDVLRTRGLQVLSTAEHGIGEEGNVHELEVLAHALAGLRANLSIRPSLFAAGPVARKVAQLIHGLPTWPQPLSGTSTHAAALVLVDRATDLPAAMLVPHTLAGLAGCAPCPALSSAKAGNVASAWWHAAAGREDGFAAAEMALQGVLPDMDSEAELSLGDSDFDFRFRSGTTTEWSPLIAHAARQCMANQDAAQKHASQDDSDPIAVLDGIPVEAASFTRAFSRLVESPISPADAPQSQRSVLIVSMRALVIGLAALCRQGGGAGHMDPVDAFLSMYGARIYGALARAVDREAGAANCTAQAYIETLRGGLCHSTAVPPSTPAQPAAGSKRAIPVAEAVSPECRSPMLYCDSMSIHSSDAETADLVQAVPDHALPFHEFPTSDLHAGAGQPVAEATEWTGGWGDDWEEPELSQVADAGDPSAGWGTDAWGEGGGWMDAPVAASQTPAAEDAVSSRKQSSEVPARTAEEAEAARVTDTPAAGDGTHESVQTAAPTAAEPPKKVVKKKIIKKVVKKVVKRKVRAGSQPAKAADADGTRNLTPDAHSPSSPRPASQPHADIAELSTAITAASSPTEPIAASSASEAELRPTPSEVSRVPQGQPTDVVTSEPEATVEMHEHVIPLEAGLDLHATASEGPGSFVQPFDALAPGLSANEDAAGEVSHVDAMADDADAATVVLPGEEPKPATSQAAVAELGMPDEEGRGTLTSQYAVPGSAGSCAGSAPMSTGSAHVHDQDIPAEAAEAPHADAGQEPQSGRDAERNPVPSNSANIDAWSDDAGWGDGGDGWDIDSHDTVPEAGEASAMNVPHAEHGMQHDTRGGTHVPQPVAPSEHMPDGKSHTPAALQSAPDAADIRDEKYDPSPTHEVPDAEPEAGLDGAMDALSPPAPAGHGPPRTQQAVADAKLPQDADAQDAFNAAPAWEGHQGAWGGDSDGWDDDCAGWQDEGWTGEHAGSGEASQGAHDVQPSEEHQSTVGHDDTNAEHGAEKASPGSTSEDVREDGIGRAWADRAAAANDGSSWTGAWFVKGLESIASKVEAVVMSPAIADGASGSSELPLRPTLGKVGHTASWGPEQWEGWGSRLSTPPQRPLRLARELGSTASLPDGPFDPVAHGAEPGQMPGVAEEAEEAPDHAPAVQELPTSHPGLVEDTAQPAAAAQELDAAESERDDQGDSAAEAPEDLAGGEAGGTGKVGDSRRETLQGDAVTGAKQAATLAVVAEDQELGVSGGLADGPVQAVPNATVVAEVSASGVQHADRCWGDSWSDATTLGTHADVCMLTEDASLLTAGPDAASVSADPGDAAGASPVGSPAGSRADTDVGSAEVPPCDTGAQGLSALAVHMHDAEASYVDAVGTSPRAASEEASRPDWSVVSTLGTDAVAAGLHTEEPALDSTPLGETRQGEGGLAAAVRGPAVRGVDLKQVGKELGWSIASTGDSAGGREADVPGASAVPEHTASPRKRLQEVVAEDVIGTRELHDAAERLLEAGWGDGWSDAATLGTQAEFEAAVLGSGVGEGQGGEAGADLQIVDEEGDAGGWAAGWGEDGGGTGEPHAGADGQASLHEAELDRNIAMPAEQGWGDGDEGWSGWAAWDEGAAGRAADATGEVQAQLDEASPEATAFAQALVRIACRCARAVRPATGMVDAVVRSAKGEQRDTHLEGITHVKGAVGSMLSHGLGALGLGSADPRLSEFSRIIIVVLGGVTMEEVAKVSQAAQSVSGASIPDIIFGGMHLTTAENLAALLINAV